MDMLAKYWNHGQGLAGVTSTFSSCLSRFEPTLILPSVFSGATGLRNVMQFESSRIFVDFYANIPLQLSLCVMRQRLFILVSVMEASCFTAQWVSSSHWKGHGAGQFSGIYLAIISRGI